MLHILIHLLSAFIFIFILLVLVASLYVCLLLMLCMFVCNLQLFVCSYLVYAVFWSCALTVCKEALATCALTVEAQKYNHGCTCI